MSLQRLRIAVAFQEAWESEERSEQEFFETVAEFFRPGGRPYQTVALAYEVIRDVSRGRIRADGRPYLSHPRGVALALLLCGYDWQTVVEGLLHDLLEDFQKEWSVARTASVFGGSITSDLLTLRRPEVGVEVATEEEAFACYARNLENGAVRAWLVKIFDRLYNIPTYRAFYKDRPAQLEKKIEETITVILPLADRVGLGEDFRFFLWKHLQIRT